MVLKRTNIHTAVMTCTIINISAKKTSINYSSQKMQTHYNLWLTISEIFIVKTKQKKSNVLWVVAWMLKAVYAESLYRGNAILNSFSWRQVFITFNNMRFMLHGSFTLKSFETIHSKTRVRRRKERWKKSVVLCKSFMVTDKSCMWMMMNILFWSDTRHF